MWSIEARGWRGLLEEETEAEGCMERLMRIGLFAPCCGAAGTVNGFAEDGAADGGGTHILLPAGPLYPQPLGLGASLVSAQLGVLGRLLECWGSLDQCRCRYWRWVQMCGESVGHSWGCRLFSGARGLTEGQQAPQPLHF